MSTQRQVGEVTLNICAIIQNESFCLRASEENGVRSELFNLCKSSKKREEGMTFSTLLAPIQKEGWRWDFVPCNVPKCRRRTLQGS